MRSSNVYVRDLDFSHEPNLDRTEQGNIEIAFEVIGDPEYDEKIRSLCGDFRISITMWQQDESIEEDRNQVGSAEVEVTVTLPGEEEEIESYIKTWKKDGYHHLPEKVRYQIESSFTTQVFGPLSSLVDNSFRGILPGILFSTEPVRIEEDTKKEIETEIEKRIREVAESEGEEADIEVDVGDFWRDDASIELGPLGEVAEKDEELKQAINEIIGEVLEQNTPENISLSTEEMDVVDSD